MLQDFVRGRRFVSLHVSRRLPGRRLLEGGPQAANPAGMTAAVQTSNDRVVVC
jgi:hypothetical protein